MFKNIYNISKYSTRLYFNKIEENLKIINKLRAEYSLILVFFLFISSFLISKLFNEIISLIILTIFIIYLFTPLVFSSPSIFKNERDCLKFFILSLFLLIPILILLNIILILVFLLNINLTIFSQTGIILLIIISSILFIWIGYINLKTYSISQNVSMFKVFFIIFFSVFITTFLFILLFLLTFIIIY